MQPSPQRALIDRIRAEFGLDPATGEVSNNRAFKNLENAVRILSEQLNTELAHFLLELVQNADDLTYKPDTLPSLVFRLIGSQLLVVSNETGFTDRDVESICSVGDSTKVVIADTRGEKGIGFKSLFKASEEVTIASNGYHFQFSLRRSCGSVVPEWKELPNEYREPAYSNKTVLLIFFANSWKMSKVKQELLNFDSKLLLFLRRLRSISIESDGQTTSIGRQDDVSKDDLSTKLYCRPNNSPATMLEYAIVTYACPVTVRDTARKNYQTTKVTLAFPVGKESETCYAYNCLPICPTGFPFLMQGEFILSASREGLNESHSEWNDMLFQALATAFSLAVKRFNKSPETRYPWLKYLPCHPPYSQFQKLSALVQQSLAKSSILVSQDDRYYIPSQVFYVPSTWRDNDNEPLVSGPSLTSPNLSTQYDAERFYNRTTVDRLRWLGCSEPSTEVLLQRFKKYLLHDGGLTYSAQPKHRYPCFARALLTYDQNKLSDLAIIPLQDGRWVAPRGLNVFFAETNKDGTVALDIPSGLPQINIVKQVYSKLANDPLKALFTKMGVKQGSEEQICSIIRATHSKNALPFADRAVLVEHAIYLYEAWNTPSYGEKFRLWMADLEGKPVLSNRVYQPAGFLDKTLLQLLPQTTSRCNVMHPDYLKALGGNEHTKFSGWLSEIGVLTHLRLGWSDCADASSNAKITDEFRKLVLNGWSSDVLQVIVSAWKANFGNSTPSSALASAIKNVKACWTGAEPLALGKTFLPSTEIKKFAPAGVPFLQEDNPNDPKWRVLRHIGVSTTVDITDPEFWLACLRALLRSEPDTANITNIYRRLSDLCKTQHTMIKHFFDENAAIYVPSRKTWIKSTDCLWTSPYVLRHRCILSSEYPAELENFFTYHLGVNNVRIDHVLEELKLWSVTDDRKHGYLRSLILALNAAFKTASIERGNDKCKGKLNALKNLAIMPIYCLSGDKMLRQTVFLNDASQEWYFIDAIRLKEAFQDKLWLADFSPEESLKLKVLMSYMDQMFFTKHPRLTEVVTENSTCQGNQGISRELTGQLRAKGVFLGAVARAKLSRSPGLESKVSNLTSVGVEWTDSITTDLSVISRKSGKVIRGTSIADRDIMIEATKDSVKVFVTAESEQLGRLPPSTAEALGSFLGFRRDDHLLLVERLMAVYTLRDARDLMVKYEIQTDSEDNSMFGASALSNAFFLGTRETAPESGGTISLGATRVLESNGAAAQAQERGPVNTFDPQPFQFTANRGQAVTPISRTVSRNTENTGITTYSSSMANFNSSSGPRRTQGDNHSIDAGERSSGKDTSQIGIDGEHLVYKKLKEVLGESFGPDNWTSELRHLADPSIGAWKPTDETTFFADFTYLDEDKVLSNWLRGIYGDSAIPTEEELQGAFLGYNIEVKATSGKGGEPFHISDWQFEEAKNMSSFPKKIDTIKGGDHGVVLSVFLVFRVSGVGGSSHVIEVISNLWKKYEQGTVGLRAPAGLVIVRK